ncbi:class II aldolase/adducin family protein [Elusimicrobiota bacterium]
MFKDFKKYGKLLFDQGLNNSHSGNISKKIGSSIQIKKHGAQLWDLGVKDIANVNLKDDKKDKSASIELKVHRAIYLSNPNIGAIVHAHTPYAVVLSLKQESLNPIDSESQYYLSEIPVFCCADTIGSDDVARGIPELFKKSKVVMVRGHGAFAVGKSIEEAAMLISVFESACRIIFLNKLIEK